MRWIAVDWGTSRLRASLMDGAAEVESRASEAGMSALAGNGFEAALLDLVADWLDGLTEVLACGMVGARQGWREAPYRAVPCAPLAGPLVRVPTRDARLSVRIVGGLRQDAPHADVMRGEETQVAGVLAEVPEFDGVMCLPGTHTKWAHVSAGEVVSFRTAMTGEMFALMAGHGVLRHSTGGGGWVEGSFLQAVSDAMSRPEVVMTRSFELRAADLLHGQAAEVARSVLSGLLIGAELAAVRAWWLGRDVVVTGADLPARAYAAALRAQGAAVRVMPAETMVRAGLDAARRLT
jgi:2-dehydro-3-deoxygalactonokinase